MAARRRQRKSTFIDDMIKMSWQANATLMVISFFGLKYVPPMFEPQSQIMKGVVTVAPSFAPIVGIMFLATTILSGLVVLKAKKKGGSFQTTQSTPNDHSSQDMQKPEAFSLDLIRKIEWKRFEELCSAYLEAKGGKAETTKVGSDGGIDIKLFKGKSDKPIALVQCKAWNTKQVGVQPIRELYGVMAAEGVPSGIFMITGTYSQDAISFAGDKNLILISGKELFQSIMKMPTEKQEHLLKVATEGDFMTPTCPGCDEKMVIRRAGKGKNYGNTFWGCTNYPRCKQRLHYKSKTV